MLRRLLLLACLTASLGLPGAAAEEEVVVVAGRAADGGMIELSLEVTMADVDAFALYSEPSHTLLWMVIDEAYVQTTHGKDWVRKVKGKGERVSLLMTDLRTPFEYPRQTRRPAPPATDTRVLLVAYRQGADDQRLMDVQVPWQEFRASVRRDRSTESDWQSCCGDDRAWTCIQCQSRSFSCTGGAITCN